MRNKTLSEVVLLCPRCKKSLHGHEHCLIASTILDPEHKLHVQELLSAIKGHSWPDVLKFQEWKGNLDNAELHAIRCPSNGLALALIYSPFTLEDPYLLLHEENLGADSPDLENLLVGSGEWEHC